MPVYCPDVAGTVSGCFRFCRPDVPEYAIGIGEPVIRLEDMRFMKRCREIEFVEFNGIYLKVYS